MKIKQMVPLPVKIGLRRGIDKISYAVGSALGTRDPLMPPPHLHGVGGGFDAAGREFMGHFVQLGELKSSDRVLDIGSGTGRMAIKLKDYIKSGSYDGTDIVKPSVDWCNTAYANYPNFRFHHSDVFNEFYNPEGKVQSAAYVFPFVDRSFDFIFLTSVFTHMYPADVRNYLREMSRMMAPGARALVTVFLLNQETRALMAAGKSVYNFRFPLDGCWTAFDDQPPESAIGFEEPDFLAWVAEAGLSISSLNYGRWRGADGISTQDILILRKAG